MCKQSEIVQATTLLFSNSPLTPILAKLPCATTQQNAINSIVNLCTSTLHECTRY
jgi:hypothetical protein